MAKKNQELYRFGKHIFKMRMKAVIVTIQGWTNLLVGSIIFYSTLKTKGKISKLHFTSVLPFQCLAYAHPPYSVLA